jgi:hypothetical protein
MFSSVSAVWTCISIYICLVSNSHMLVYIYNNTVYVVLCNGSVALIKFLLTLKIILLVSCDDFYCNFY